MPPPSSGPLRLARAAGVAGAVVGLAAGAHRMGGGELPGPLALLALAAIIFALNSALAGRRFGVRVLALVLGGGQLVLHGTLNALASLGCVPAAVPGSSTQAIAHLGHAAGTTLSSPPRARTRPD